MKSFYNSVVAAVKAHPKTAIFVTLGFILGVFILVHVF